MKKILKITAIVSSLFTVFSANAASFQEIDEAMRLYNYAEEKYPELFRPSTNFAAFGNYVVKFYPDNAYIGIKGKKVFVRSKAVTNGFMQAGSIYNYIEEVDHITDSDNFPFTYPEN